MFFYIKKFRTFQMLITTSVAGQYRSRIDPNVDLKGGEIVSNGVYTCVKIFENATYVRNHQMFYFERNFTVNRVDAPLNFIDVRVWFHGCFEFHQMSL